MNRARVLFFLIFPFIFILDRFSKELVLRLLPLQQSEPFMPPLLYLTHVHNTGAAFSLLKGQQWLLLAVALLVIGFLAAYSFRLKGDQILLAAGMALLLGGTLGNLYDRMILHYVVDFVDLRFWPVFNVADMAIDTGVALILYDTFFPKKTADGHTDPLQRGNKLTP